MIDRHRNRKAHNRIELTNKQFGKLKVVGDTGKRKSRRPIWLCLCECGKEVEVNGKYLLCGDTKSCGCITKGNAHNRKAVGKINGSYWSRIKSNAKTRGIPFEIQKDNAWKCWQEQRGKCALSDIDLVLVDNFRDDYQNQTASLDRIDSTSGYLPDNIQWVHKKVNIMKNKLSEDEFIGLCNKVVQKWMKEKDL